jgi:periplasmic copper chaperone A
MIRRFATLALLASSALLLSSGVASAHIDPDPKEAQAGSRLSVGFTVEHGCDGSPTVQLDMRLPDGVTDPAPEAVDGWDGSVDVVDGDTIVTFVGGSLPDDVEGTFAVTMTLPPTPDTTIYFPFVQRCDVGEIRWIGIPAEPGDELDEPAPAMALTGPVATPPTTEPAEPPATDPAEPPATETTVTETTAADSVATTTAPAAGTTEVPATSEPLVISENADGGVDSSTGTIVFIVSIVAVLGIGAFVVYRSRQARADVAPNAR